MAGIESRPGQPRGEVDRPERTLMTQSAYDILQEELKRAKRTEREAHNDYREAKLSTEDWREEGSASPNENTVGLAVRNVARIQAAVNTAQIIEPRRDTDVVGVGNSVVLEFDGGKTDQFDLLGPTDFSVRQKGVISYLAPVGQALIGKSEGDVAPYKEFDNLRVATLARVKIIQILPGQFPGPREQSENPQTS